MQVRSITVSRTYNLGNYQLIKLELSADLESMDSAEGAATILNAKLDIMRRHILDNETEWNDEPAASSVR